MTYTVSSKGTYLDWCDPNTTFRWWSQSSQTRKMQHDWLVSEPAKSIQSRRVCRYHRRNFPNAMLEPSTSRKAKGFAKYVAHHLSGIFSQAEQLEKRIDAYRSAHGNADRHWHCRRCLGTRAVTERWRLTHLEMVCHLCASSVLKYLKCGREENIYTKLAISVN